MTEETKPNGSTPGATYEGEQAAQLYASFGPQFPPIRIDPSALAQALSEGTPYRAFPTGFAQMPTRRRGNATDELGHDGTVLSAGLVDTLDHNDAIQQDDWLGYQHALGIVDTMRREDPAIAAGVATWTLAIAGANWRVEPPEDPTPEEQEQADFVEACFTSHLSGGMHRFIEQAASFVWRGVMWFEIVFRHDATLGRNVLHKLAPRLPWSIERIEREDDGRFSLLQSAPMGDDVSYDLTEVRLPADKLLHLVYNPDGEAPIGVSILRACHAAYRLRKQFTILAGAGYERAALGIPYVEVDARVPRGSESQVDTLLRELRSGSRKYLALPPGFQLKFAEFPMKTADLREDRIEAKREIAMAMLVPHLSSEEGRLGGSHIQGQVDAFETAVQAAAEAIGRELSEGPHALVKRLVDHNWSDVKRYPRIVPGIIRVGDFSRLLTAAKEMASVGLLEQNRDVLRWVHDLLGAPPPDDDATQPPPAQQAPPEQAEGEPEGPEPVPDRGNPSSKGEDESGDAQEANEQEGEEVRKAQSEAPIDFSVPSGVKAELRRGLAWHEQGYSGDGLRPATVAWARRMANGSRISPEKARKMRAWLARHAVDKKGEGFRPGQPGYPSPGRVAWALWGGDPAVGWSSKLVRQIDARKAASAASERHQHHARHAAALASGGVCCGADHGPVFLADVSTRFDADVATVGPRGREVHPLETVVRFSETRQRVETDTDELVRAIERFRRVQGERYADAMVRTGDLKKAADVSVKGAGALTAELEATLRRSYRAGGEAVEAEVGRIERDEELRQSIEQGTADRSEEGMVGGARALARRSTGRVKAPKPVAPGTSATDDIDPEESVLSVASTTVKGVIARMVTEALAVFQALSIGGTIPEADYETASERIATTLANLSSTPDRRQAAKDTRSIYGLGRVQKGRSLEGVEKGMFSNLLESATCGPCEAEDMRIFPISRYDEFATPYKECEGGDLCNCLVIFLPTS